MTKAKERIGLIIMAAALLLGLPGMMVAAPPVEASPAPPDLTQGGKPDNEHRWTLGATGARGWVWSRYVAGGSENTDARQILITEVAKDSPADGVLQDGDVITGLNGQAFGGNARILFAQALTEAETEANGGLLKLVRWRAGKTENVQLKLPVLGTYAPTAPYDCAKSKRIFEQGCEAIAKRGFKDKQGNVQVSIENDMNALALLALLKDPNDGRQRLVGEVAKALFAPMPGTNEPTPILSKSLDAVDRPLLYATLKEVLANEDGLIRGLAAPIYPLLSAEDAKALLPEIVAATRKNAPSGEMFRYGIRWAGLDLLARFRIREGMALCVDMMNEFEWGREQNQCTKPLKKYGGAAKEVIPRLQETILALRKAIEAEPWNGKTWNKDILAIEQLIKEIEADQNLAPVVSIEEFIGKKEQP